MEKATSIYEQDLRDVVQSLKNIALSSGALAEGTADASIKTTATITFMVDGVFKSKSATDNIAPTVCASQAAGKRCRYLISIDAAGTVTVTKGTEAYSLSTGAIITLSWDPIQKKLMDSAKSLTFNAGDIINVSGFTRNENNGLFTVEVAASDGSWVQVRETGMVEEAAGDSVTVLRESLLPECPVKQAAIGIMIVTTGTAAFIVGTDDITGDIGTGSVSFVDTGLMPTEFV